VDVDADAVARGRELHPRLLLHQIIDSSELPYPDGYFDTVSILDVLEHLDVSTQLAALEELRRALRRGGHLIVTVPGQHIFSFLDLGNLKFRFPRVHRFFYTRVHGDAAYRYRYVENPYGLIGDVAATKAWHEHFSGQRLRALVEPTGFTLVNLDGSGFFERPLLALRTAIPWQAARSVLDAIREWDARAFQSCNLFATFRKTE
jgi:SAM-dependent methyltransferase